MPASTPTACRVPRSVRRRWSVVSKVLSARVACDRGQRAASAWALSMPSGPAAINKHNNSAGRDRARIRVGASDGARRTEKYPRQRISILAAFALVTRAAKRRLRFGEAAGLPASSAARADGRMEILRVRDLIGLCAYFSVSVVVRYSFERPWQACRAVAGRRVDIRCPAGYLEAVVAAGPFRTSVWLP